MTCICHPAHRCGRCDVPTRSELATELATRNDRCAATDEHGVCLKAKQHVGPCDYETTISIIPFE